MLTLPTRKQKMVKTINFKKSLLAALSLTAFSIGLYYTIRKNASELTLYTFDEQRDTEFILDIFKNDWYWLVSEYSTDFSPEYMLANRASSRAPQHKGNLAIKTLYKKTEPLGFVAFYKKSFYKGLLLFLAVRQKHRGKGYAYYMLKDAIKEMKAMGLSVVRLVTRTNNESSQKLYTRFGFKEVEREDGFVYFEYKL